MTDDALKVSITESFQNVSAEAWNQLGDQHYPFSRHQFLLGLEQHQCLEPFGWQGVHFLVHRKQQLVAAIPCYLKSNSYGELVFDHAWSNAYQRSGVPYYPKLVSAIPYTPATGERFLINQHEVPQLAEQHVLKKLLYQSIQEFCEQQGLSSWHLLFADKQTLDSFQNDGLDQRCDVQFHWQNNQYQDFDDFLAKLSSRKRKNIRKERNSVIKSGLSVQMHSGDELSPADWLRVHQLYASIYHRKHGTATLTAGFFQHLGDQMPKQVVVALAREKGEIMAASLFFRSNTHLYGRVWGCDEYYRHLHFESCYYQGIDYCISEGLQCFDPGAQGEHKLSRGFLPTLTWSGHWISHPQFREAIAEFLEQERPYVKNYRDELLSHSPFRSDEP